MGKFLVFWWLIWNMSVCVQEKVPARPDSDTPVSQAVSLIRDHVKGLSGSLLLSSLLATLAGLFLVKAIFSWVLGGRKPRPASADHKTRKSKEPSETAEKSQAAAPSNRGGKKDSSEKKDSQSSPRKRKWALAVTLCLCLWPYAMTNDSLSQVYIFFLRSNLWFPACHTPQICVTTTAFYLFAKPLNCTVLYVIGFECQQSPCLSGHLLHPSLYTVDVPKITTKAQMQFFMLIISLNCCWYIFISQLFY